MSEKSRPCPDTLAPAESTSHTIRAPWYIGGLLIGSVLILGGLNQGEGTLYSVPEILVSEVATGDAPSAGGSPEATDWRARISAPDSILDDTGSGDDIFGWTTPAELGTSDTLEVFPPPPDTSQDDGVSLFDVASEEFDRVGGKQTSEPIDTDPFIGPQRPPALLADKQSGVPSTFHLVIQPGDNLDSRFRRLGVAQAELTSLIQAPHARELLSKIHTGEVLVLTINPDASVSHIEYQARDGRTLTINRSEDGFQSELSEPTQLPAELVVAKGSITSSFYAAARAAGLNPSARSRVANMLRSQVNFDTRIRANDRFRVLYEQRVDNRGNELQQVIAAELVNRGKTYRALRYTTESGRTGNFSPTGESLDAGFLRYPVAYTRISSRFSKRRWHPKLNRVRAHLGVDLAAPMGTPVKASAAGTVVFSGRKNGYGNVLEIKHGDHYKTVYAHLSRFRAGIHKGDRVRKGSTIAYVGKSGLATGPHLHYEFHRDGKPLDPLSASLPNGPVLAGKEIEAFKLFAKAALEKLGGKTEPVTVAATADPAVTSQL